MNRGKRIQSSFLTRRFSASGSIAGAGGTGADEVETRLAAFSSTGDSMIAFSLTGESISLQSRAVGAAGEGNK